MVSQCPCELLRRHQTIVGKATQIQGKRLEAMHSMMSWNPEMACWKKPGGYGLLQSTML